MIENQNWQQFVAIEESHYNFRDISKTFKSK